MQEILSKASMELNAEYWRNEYNRLVTQATEALMKWEEAKSDLEYYYGVKNDE